MLQSSLQTAPCSDQPASLCTTAAHSATPAIRVPTACDTDGHKCLMAGQSSHLPPLTGPTAIPPVLAQPASHAIAQECLFRPAVKAQSQHFPRPRDADAASRVIHEAARSAAALAFNRLPDATSAGMSVGSLSLGDRPHADHPSAVPSHASHLRSVFTDACKVHSSSTDPQPLPRATDPPFTDQWAARALVTTLPPSTPSSATTDILAEPTAVTTQAMSICLQRDQLSGCQEGDAGLQTGKNLCPHSLLPSLAAQKQAFQRSRARQLAVLTMTALLLVQGLPVLTLARPCYISKARWVRPSAHLKQQMQSHALRNLPATRRDPPLNLKAPVPSVLTEPPSVQMQPAMSIMGRLYQQHRSRLPPQAGALHLYFQRALHQYVQQALIMRLLHPALQTEQACQWSVLCLMPL